MARTPLDHRRGELSGVDSSAGVGRYKRVSTPAELLIGLFPAVKQTSLDKGDQGLVEAVAQSIVRPEDAFDRSEIAFPKATECLTELEGCAIPVGPVRQSLGKVHSDDRSCYHDRAVYGHRP